MSDHDGTRDGWVPNDIRIPMDPTLESRIVTSIESLTVVWGMIDPDTDVEILAPYLILTFYTRGGHEVEPLVLSLGALSSLMSATSDHFVRTLGGVDAIDGAFTEEGLQRMMKDIFPNTEEGL